MRQMLWRVRCGRKWATTKVRPSSAKLVARGSTQTTARSSSVAFQGSLCGLAEWSRQSSGPRACATCGRSRCCVWSRDEVGRVGLEDGRVLGPGLADGLEGRSPPQRLEVLGEVGGSDEGQDVGLEGLEVRI